MYEYNTHGSAIDKDIVMGEARIIRNYGIEILRSLGDIDEVAIHGQETLEMHQKKIAQINLCARFPHSVLLPVLEQHSSASTAMNRAVFLLIEKQLP
jgi:hypothetical protein